MNMQAPIVDAHKLISGKHFESSKGDTENEGHWGFELLVNFCHTIIREGLGGDKGIKRKKNSQISLLHFRT